MIALIALIASLVTLAINIIIHREELKKFYDDVRKSREENDEKNKALEVTYKYKAIPISQVELIFPKPIALRFSYFLLMVAASAIISFFGFQSPPIHFGGNQNARYSFYAVTASVFIIEPMLRKLYEQLEKIKPARREYAKEIWWFLFSCYMWGYFTLGVSFLFPTIYAGIAASAFVQYEHWWQWRRVVKKMSEGKY